MAARKFVFVLATVLALAWPTPAPLEAEGKTAKKARRAGPGKRAHGELKRTFQDKPLKDEKQVKFSHAPYLQAGCSICHESDDRNKPGKLRAPTNKICLSCHESTLKEMKENGVSHEPVQKDCSYCHNSHNSKYRFLLHDTPRRLCSNCHGEVAAAVRKSRVKHDPTIKGLTCRNCHTSHSSRVEHLLRGLPSQLCLECHGKDDIVGKNGDKLINIGKLLATKPVHHEPVDKKDCSACHAVHGNNNFRLLAKPYPSGFYAPFGDETYALCFNCHKKETVTQAETTTATAFRDKNRNLHTVHVVTPERGRTCRACHGEHASELKHLIREQVPYGPQGWMLNINYRPTPTGGTCTKTCHGAKGYNNK